MPSLTARLEALFLEHDTSRYPTPSHAFEEMRLETRRQQQADLVKDDDESWEAFRRKFEEYDDGRRERLRKIEIENEELRWSLKAQREEVRKKTLELGDEFRKSYYFSPLNLKATDWWQGGGELFGGSGGSGTSSSLSKSFSTPVLRDTFETGSGGLSPSRRAAGELVEGMAGILSDGFVSDERFSNASRGSYQSTVIARKKERLKLGGGAGSVEAAEPRRRQHKTQALAEFFSPVKVQRSMALQASASTPILNSISSGDDFGLPPIQRGPLPPAEFVQTSFSPAASTPTSAHQHTYSNDSAMRSADPMPIKGPSWASSMGTHEARPRGFKRMGPDFGASGMFISRESAAYIT